MEPMVKKLPRGSIANSRPLGPLPLAPTRSSNPTRMRPAAGPYLASLTSVTTPCSDVSPPVDSPGSTVPRAFTSVAVPPEVTRHTLPVLVMTMRSPPNAQARSWCRPVTVPGAVPGRVIDPRKAPAELYRETVPGAPVAKMSPGAKSARQEPVS